jgi:HNH endonuclease
MKRLKYRYEKEDAWEFVQVSDGCWLWLGQHHYRRRKDGTVEQRYGKFKTGGVYHEAHRLVYELSFGPIPDGLMVLHTCDNMGCVRPDHLFLGTASDNVMDMITKGRHVHGDDHWTRKHPENVLRGENHWMSVHRARVTTITSHK